MSFRLRDHTADVAVEAEGATLDATFAAVAEGLTAAMCEAVPAGGDRFSFAVTAEAPEATLFEYLDELIYQRDVREVLPVDHEVRIERSDGDRADAPGGDTETMASGRDGEPDADGGGEPDADGDGDDWHVTASARGVPFAEVVARDVKAVTYSEMRLDRTDDGWTAYVVFDV